MFRAETRAKLDRLRADPSFDFSYMDTLNVGAGQPLPDATWSMPH
jgi:hypothetical protein